MAGSRRREGNYAGIRGRRRPKGGAREVVGASLLLHARAAFVAAPLLAEGRVLGIRCFGTGG